MSGEDGESVGGKEESATVSKPAVDYVSVHAV